MAYSNAAAVSRPELKVFAEQAREADKGLIADKVLPLYQSDSMTGRYPLYDLKGGRLLNVDLDTKRGPHGSYNRVNRSWDWDTFDCEDRGLEGFIDDVQAAEMKRFISLEQSETKLVRRNVALAYEVRVADLVMDSAKSGINASNGAAAYTEAGIVNIDLPRDVLERKTLLEGRGCNPEDLSMVLSSTLWNLVRRSPKLLQYVFGTTVDKGNAKLSLQQVAEALELKEIIVGVRSRNTANKGKTPVLTPIWGTSTILLANIQAGEFNNGGLGRTITWTEDASGLYVVETYRSEEKRSDIVRVRQNTTEKIIDKAEAELITTQWA